MWYRIEGIALNEDNNRNDVMIAVACEYCILCGSQTTKACSVQPCRAPSYIQLPLNHSRVARCRMKSLESLSSHVSHRGMNSGVATRIKSKVRVVKVFEL